MSNFKLALIAGIVFTAVQAIYFGFTIGFFGVVVMAPISGLFFGTVIYFFSKSKRIQTQTQITIDENRALIKSGPANHFKKGEAVGGRLYLIDNCIKFKSHKLNIQNHELEIPIEFISSVGTFNSLGIIPNGLLITTKDHQTFKFVVTGRKDWIEAFRNLH